MSIFSSNKQLEKKIEDLTAENADLKASAEDLKANNDELSEKLASATNKNQELKKQLSEATENADKIKAEADQKVKAADEKVAAAENKIKEETEKLDEKVAAAAASKVASIGHEAVEETAEDHSAEASVEDLQKQVKSANSAEEKFKINMQILKKLGR